MRTKPKVRTLEDSEKQWLNKLRRNLIPCEHCEDGYLPSIYEGVLNTCICKRVTMFVSALVRARIPKKYWWNDFGELDDLDPDVEAVTDAYIGGMGNAIDEGMGIMYFGRNGTGKTALMCEIGKYALARGFRVLYLTADEYVSSLRKPEVEDLDFSNADVVILDEIEKVYKAQGSSFADRAIEDSIRRGMNRNQSFLMGTNYYARKLSKEEYQAGYERLADHVSPSLLSLLMEGTEFCEVPGRDRRKDKAAEWLEKLERESSWDDYYEPPIPRHAHNYGEAIMIENAEHLWGESYHEHKIS